MMSNAASRLYAIWSDYGLILASVLVQVLAIAGMVLWGYWS